ncbi:MAG TPA: hypothetical protein VH621_00835, partial [Nitrososphaera sp.]
MQFETDLMLFAIRKGAITSAGMLAAIKSVWNGARAAALEPAPATLIPIRVEKRLPAHVGQPTNRPHVAPTPPAREVVACI